MTEKELLTCGFFDQAQPEKERLHSDNEKNFIQALLELFENTGDTSDCQAVNETLENRKIVEDYYV